MAALCMINKRVYRYKREKKQSYHNFGQYQIYVCYMIDLKGNMHPGITVLRSDNIIEVPYPFSKAVAQSFASFLEEAAKGILPANFKLKGSLANMFSSTKFSFSSQKGEMIKANYFQGIFVFGRYVWASVKPSSIMACAQSIKKLEWPNA